MPAFKVCPDSVLANQFETAPTPNQNCSLISLWPAMGDYPFQIPYAQASIPVYCSASEAVGLAQASIYCAGRFQDPGNKICSLAGLSVFWVPRAENTKRALASVHSLSEESLVKILPGPCRTAGDRCPCGSRYTWTASVAIRAHLLLPLFACPRTRGLRDDV